MKRAGVLIFVIGMALAVYTGFHYFTREKLVDLGEVEITTNKRHRMNWSPLVGVGVMAVGAVIFVAGIKKK